MRIANENLISSAVSLGADANLRPIWIAHICNYSIQLVFTGTPVGTFKLQGSNDEGQINASGSSQQYTGVSNWTDIVDSSVSVSAAGNVMWNVENAGYLWVRVVYTRGSSTGSLTSARANLKGV